MSTQKVIISGIVGGIVFFLFGFLIYAKLLHGFAMSHPGSVDSSYLMRPEKAMMGETLYILAGNMAFGFLLAIIFGRWTNFTTVSSGLLAGFAIGLLMAGGFHSISYGTTNIMSRTWMVVDTLAFGVLSAIAGAAVSWVLGMGKKSS